MVQRSGIDTIKYHTKSDRNLVMETRLVNVAVLFVMSFPLDSGKINFPIQIATIRMGLSLMFFKGSQVDFPNKCIIQSLNIAFIIANSADLDEMQQTKGLFPFIR